MNINSKYRTGEYISGNIEYFTAYTLVDITDTGVFDPTAGVQFEQAQNLNAFLQAISLASQPILTSVEKLTAIDLVDFDFGSSFTGDHNVWILRFASERMGTTTAAGLVRDLDGLPVYDNLDETVVLASAVVDTTGATTLNTYFVRNDNL